MILFFLKQERDKYVNANMKCYMLCNCFVIKLLLISMRYNYWLIFIHSSINSFLFFPLSPSAVPDIPSAPINMSYSYVIGETVSANFTWAPPTRSQYPLSGYRIYWAQVKPSSGLPHAALPTIEREEFTSTLLREVGSSFISPPSMPCRTCL